MKISIDKLQIFLFKIYLILLPISFLQPLKLNSYLGAIAMNSGFIFHMIGLLLIFINLCINKKLRTNKLMTYLAFMILILNISSLFMAFCLNYELGILYGEDTYRAVLGDIIYYCHILLVFYYNYMMGNKIDKCYISKIFFIITIFELFIGYIQILIINGFGFLVSFHLILEKIGIANGIMSMMSVGKIYLTGSEASSVAEIVGFIILPFLFANILTNEKPIYKILLLAYIPIIYFSKSTTVYIAIAAQVGIFILLLLKKKKNSTKSMVQLIAVSIICFLSVGTVLKYTDSSLLEEAKYYLIEKVSDQQNLSTVFRESSVKNNIDVFLKYPILGIGNGLQGYFYEDNLAYYAYKSDEVKDVLTGDSGIPSGGSFLTSYLSGYGVVGIFLLIILGYLSIKTIKKQNELYYVYIFGMINFILLSTMALGIAGNYVALFIVSIPLFNNRSTELEEIC